ncbi:MAG TPA: anti-sigma factor [Bryobacteraceae bacterium]|nr:anti-sigma factor [Bryobacteraceae bacterium]
MSCDELSDLYELYALGALESEERAEIDAHLARGCPDCQRGVHRALLINAGILSCAPDIAPPKRLRKRVLASVGVETPAWGWIAGWGAVTAALLIATLWYSAISRQRTEELAIARRQVAQTDAALARVQQVLDFLDAPETRQVSFGAGQPSPPRGRVLLNPAKGVLFIAANLPALPRGKTYEMWVIPKGGAPRPAGLFQSDQHGNAVHLQPGPVDLSTTSAVAVSVEPESGSAAPTTQPIIVAPAAGS